jgi:hypothetical protein
LPQEFWLEEILVGIGNTIGVYVKSSEATKQRRYTSYARICVYLNISKPLPGSIALNTMMRTGLKLLIMSTYLFVVENVMNMDIFSEISLSTSQARPKTLKQVNQKMTSYKWLVDDVVKWPRKW